MRYSVNIYDPVGIEEASIVCETKADAQELAVRCAKMYAGEGYTIEIEKEPDRWEGILGTREMRRQARREGKRRKPDSESDGEVIEIIPLDEPVAEEPVPVRGRGRGTGSSAGSEVTTMTSAASSPSPSSVGLPRLPSLRSRRRVSRVPRMPSQRSGSFSISIL